MNLPRRRDGHIGRTTESQEIFDMKSLDDFDMKSLDELNLDVGALGNAASEHMAKVQPVVFSPQFMGLLERIVTVMER